MITRGLLAMLRNRANRREIYSQAAFWDGKAVDYTGESISLWPNKSLSRLYAAEHEDALNELVGPLQGKAILDAGCGTGRLSRMLARRGASVRAIDFSEHTLRQARELTDEALDIEFQLGSLFELLDVEEFDWIMSCAATTMACQTRSDFRGVLEKFYRALKPGGAVFFLEPFHAGVLSRTLRLSAADASEDLQEAGFQITHYQELHFWPIRVILSYFDLPSSVTSRAYAAGRRLETFFPNLSWGDYKLIIAIKATESA